MTNELLDIHPGELKFIVELNKQSSCPVQFFNKSDHYVAFKIKTNSREKHYTVLKNTGIIEPKSTYNVIGCTLQLITVLDNGHILVDVYILVTMRANMVAHPDMKCKDKFLVQGTVVSAGTMEDDVTPSLFAGENGKYVERRNLKVVLASPPHSTIASPINEVHDQVPVRETSPLEDEVLWDNKNISPQLKKNHDIDKSLDEMGVLENLSEALATNEAKREQFKKVVLLLMLEWEDFQSHLDLSGVLFQECLAELQSKDTHLNSVHESVGESSKEMDLIRISLEQKLAEFVENKEFDLFQEERSKELKLQEENLSLIREEIEVRELKLNEQEKLIEGLFEKIEAERKEIEIIRNSAGEMFNEIGLKEYRVEQRAKELDLKDQKLMQREKEIQSREKILDLKKKEIELKGRQIDSATISKRQLQISVSGPEHGLKPEKEESFAPSEQRKQSSEAPGHIASHQDVTDHQSKKQLDSSVNSMTILEPCCFFCDVREVVSKFGLKESRFCKPCSKYYIALASAMDYEENGPIEMLRLCARTVRDNDTRWGARTEKHGGDLNTMGVGEGDYDVSRFDDFQYRENSESMGQSRKKGNAETENEVRVAEEVSAVNDYHRARMSVPQLLLCKKGRESGADDVASSSKRLRFSDNHDELIKAASLHYSACGGSIGFSADVDDSNRRIVEGTAQDEESFQSCDIRDVQVSKGYAEESSQNFGVTNVPGLGSADHSVTGIICPPGEFNDFDKYRNDTRFSAGQIWACYDDTQEAMPRFYARIKKVDACPFKLCINWLHLHPRYQDSIERVNKDLPIACGEFTHATSEHWTTSHIFSHQVNYDKDMVKKTYSIYPRNGEIWALFKDWDAKSRSDAENHPRTRYGYDYVQIVKEVKNTGVEVAYLEKVGAFLSLYQRTSQGHSVLIPPDQLLRFSHRVPSYAMNGTEGEGVPEGSFELDPAALPLAPQ